jgi:hypothetical protein
MGRIWRVIRGHPGPSTLLALFGAAVIFAARELVIERMASAANGAIDDAIRSGWLSWFVTGGAWATVLILMLVFAAAAAWLAFRVGRHGYGKHYCLNALDDLYNEGVGLRNGLLQPIPGFQFQVEKDKLEAWDDKVVQLLGYLSIPARSRFRTLNLFQPKFAAVEGKDPQQILLETFWNEKLDRLRAEIDKLEHTTG